jgi:hypothetical protein
MDEIITGESVETTPAPVEEAAAASPEQTADEQFDGLMAAAADRMAGAQQPAPAPAAETTQDAEPVEPEAKSEPQEEGPRLLRIKVNGEEMELPEDKLVALAQQGVDYTRKTQALSERSKQLEAWGAVINRIQSEPQLQARFRALFDDSQAQQAPVQQPQGNEPPADPIDRLKWEIRQEVMAEVEGKIKPLAERPAQLEQAMTLQSFKNEIQRDPVYPQALKLVQQYVANQPEFAREALYQRLDRDPRAFLEVYGPARAHALTQAQQAREAQAAPAPEPKPAPVQRTVKPREAAPTLESAGGAPAAGVESTRRSQDLKALTKRVRSNQADGQDLVAYLDLSGALKRMG